MNEPKWPEKKVYRSKPNWKIHVEYINGWNLAIDACKNAYDEVKQNDSNISPHKLYEMANGDTEKYKELMVAHGYLIPKAKGQELVALDENKLSQDLGKFNIEFNGKSPHFQWCNFMAKRICSTFATPKPRAGVSMEDIRDYLHKITKGVDKDIKGEISTTYYGETPAIAQAIHKLLSEENE